MEERLLRIEKNIKELGSLINQLRINLELMDDKIDRSRKEELEIINNIKTECSYTNLSEEERNIKILKDKIKKDELILFVGSGVSANLGLPTWGQMMEEIAKDIGMDREIFMSYSDNYGLAEYYSLIDPGLGRLTNWMRTNWLVNSKKLVDSKIHRLIFNLDFPIIYTTNYDRNIERLYDLYQKEYTRIVSVEDICKIKNNKTQIIKFHGDIEEPESIVLTETSYFERMDFESPLDIKLRSDILGKSVLFIGYSLSDINIKYLIYRLNKIWKDAGYKNEQPKSYIFLTSPNIVEEEILKSKNIIPIVGKSVDRKRSLEGFLESLI